MEELLDCEFVEIKETGDIILRLYPRNSLNICYIGKFKADYIEAIREMPSESYLVYLNEHNPLMYFVSDSQRFLLDGFFYLTGVAKDEIPTVKEEYDYVFNSDELEGYLSRTFLIDTNKDNIIKEW